MPKAFHYIFFVLVSLSFVGCANVGRSTRFYESTVYPIFVRYSVVDSTGTTYNSEDTETVKLKKGIKSLHFLIYVYNPAGIQYQIYSQFLRMDTGNRVGKTKLEYISNVRQNNEPYKVECILGERVSVVALISFRDKDGNKFFELLPLEYQVGQ